VRSYNNDDRCVVLGEVRRLALARSYYYHNAAPFTPHTYDYYIDKSAEIELTIGSYTT
jgi:hypothetical protein